MRHRSVSRGRVTRRLPAADIAENLKYFSPIPHSLRSVPALSSLLVYSPSSLPPPTIKLTKGNIKLNYARSTARFGGRRDRCNGASNIQRTAISLNTHACFALIVIKRIAINPERARQNLSEIPLVDIDDARSDVQLPLSGMNAARARRISLILPVAPFFVALNKGTSARAY